MSVTLNKRGPYREAMKRLRRGWRWHRADYHLVSYPKCGRTWLVLLVAEAVQRHFGVRTRNPLKIRRLSSRLRGIPYIHPHHDGGPEFRLPEEISEDKSQYRGRNVLFLVRDPRDVLVSSYFQKAKRNYNFSGTIDQYLRERRGGLESIIRFYNIWAANREVPANFLLVTYEDLLERTGDELARTLAFLGLHEISREAQEVAVEACRFENMRQLERSDRFKTGALSPRDPADETTYKTRQGKAGGFREHLDQDQIEWIDGMIQAQLDPFYERYLQRTAMDQAR